ncbi:MAG: hypothetical protein PHX96_05630, partial [Candidatus Nanoarchaeia archaeon]|nr:hypothetical protein [Candidatus Nanoarchaeia archaeon]
MSLEILVNISIGELLDKISVLEIKKEKIGNKEKSNEINKELITLKKICEENLKGYEIWVKKLKEINLIVYDNIEKQWEKEKNRE